MTNASEQRQVPQQPQAGTQAARRPVDTLKQVLGAESVQAQFRNALGAHKDAFVASLVDLFSGDRQLQECKPADVVAEALRAATLHLPLNKALGFSYIVVFRNATRRPDGSWARVATPTFMLGYKGYIQLAMRTGQYRTINADVVYEGELGRVDKLSGAIAFDGERTGDKVVGYFCHFELLNGFSKTLYMTVEEMARYARRYSPSLGRDVTWEQLAQKANDQTLTRAVGWTGNFNDMAIKTVVRRLLGKYGYLSVEMQTALAKDIEADDPMAARDEALREMEEAKTVDEAQFEEVIDAETGEVITKPKEEEQPQQPQAEQPAQPKPRQRKRAEAEPVQTDLGGNLMTEEEPPY
ncbi:MAG: recombinase RecT [Prevotellaceae bacterium]|nr:recombinase RecT [Prevotellaceae bacterium]